MYGGAQKGADMEEIGTGQEQTPQWWWETGRIGGLGKVSGPGKIDELEEIVLLVGVTSHGRTREIGGLEGVVGLKGQKGLGR